MASTSPKRDSVLMEKPKRGKNANVPTSETGTAHKGIRVARHPCKKRKTTIMTRINASTRVMTISLMPSVTGSVVSREIEYSRSCGKRFFQSAISFLTRSAVSIALDPGSW
ncbi:MAG: hypothetical protein ILNGONEN_01708 [Syntrophorhabdaceae bacterium]|nr:hypothetical protein [Syntrophorhabdaceae bacterium]